MCPNVFNESVQDQGPYSKMEIQKLQQQLENMPLEEIRKQLDGLSTQVENKLKYANVGSLDAKYKKFLNVRENLTLIDGLYDKLPTEQQNHVDNYKQGGSERSVAVTQSALLQLWLLPKDTTLGVFDKNTLYAVISFQKTSKDYKGQQDGLIGKQTLTALQAALDSNPVPPVVSDALTTTTELEQIKTNIQDLEKQVEAVIPAPVIVQEESRSVPLVEDNKSVVLTQSDVVDNSITSVVAPVSIENTQVYVDAATTRVQNSATGETVPSNTVTTTEQSNTTTISKSKDAEEVVIESTQSQDKEVEIDPEVSQRELQAEFELAEKEAQKKHWPVTVVDEAIKQVELDKDESIIESDKSTTIESRNPTYNTLDDYIATYMDTKWYSLGETPAELQKQIQQYRKEALLADTSILRYGMVLRAKDVQGNYYVGTLVEDPSKKDFTKSNVLRVNRSGKNNTIENIAFPLENIVEVLPNEKKVLDPNQQKEYDRLEAKYKKEQEKVKNSQEKTKQKESKKSWSKKEQTQ